MKRALPILLISVIVLSILVVSFSTAEASSDWNDPTVTPLSGDIVFTTKVLPPSEAPGTFMGENGLVYPSGTNEGEKQFGGNILVVTGMDFGTAKACYSFPIYSYGWRGSIVRWNGTKWTNLVTKVTEGKDGVPPLACATITSSGTYGLMIGFDKTLAPVKAENCSQDLQDVYMYWNNAPGDGYLYTVGLIFTGTIRPGEGDPFTWSISNQTPYADYLTPVSGSGTVGLNLDEDPYIVIPDLYFSGDQVNNSFTLHVYTPECHVINIVNTFR